MESHCDTDCPKAPIACNFSLFGCKERVSDQVQGFLCYQSSTLLREQSLKFQLVPQSQWPCRPGVTNRNCLPLQMQRHDLAQHMQEFTQMHMRYMAEFLRAISLNGTPSTTLCAMGPSVSFEDQGAAASASVSSGHRGAVSCSSNCTPCQHNEEMQRLGEMDRRLVKQDHQLRELIIFKENQVHFLNFQILKCACVLCV